MGLLRYLASYCYLLSLLQSGLMDIWVFYLCFLETLLEFKEQLAGTNSATFPIIPRENVPATSTTVEVVGQYKQAVEIWSKTVSF